MVRYVIIPSDLAHDLHEPLRRHYGEDSSIHVIVERRDPADPPAGKPHRRANDRGPDLPARRVTVSTPPPGALPPEALPHANRLRFLRAIDPAAPEVADRESLRLVARFQHGDQDAFDTLYRRHYESVYGYLRMSLRNAHHAEDVAQQVFLRALQALPRYRFQAGVPFWSWLREIARNEARRALRSRGVTVEPRDPTELDRASAAQAGWESERELVALGEQLPAREQQVFMLRYGIGLSIADTATVMSASEDAVKSLSKRAVARLREELRGPDRPTADPPAHRLAMRSRLRLSPVLGRRRAALAA